MNAAKLFPLTHFQTGAVCSTLFQSPLTINDWVKWPLIVTWKHTTQCETLSPTEARGLPPTRGSQGTVSKLEMIYLWNIGMFITTVIQKVMSFKTYPPASHSCIKSQLSNLCMLASSEWVKCFPRAYFLSRHHFCRLAHRIYECQGLRVPSLTDRRAPAGWQR